jgi:predicted flap endonuclease-1-like 5' DNA nuclease
MFRKVAILFVLLFPIAQTSAFASPLAQMEGEGNPWWLWLIIFAVLALFVGFMLWWWLHEPEEEATATRHRPAAVDKAHDMPDSAVDDEQIAAAYTSPQDTEEILAAEAKTLEPDTAALEVVEPQIAQPTAAPLDAAAPNDLTIVEGIGPAIQKMLYAAGITTYRNLAMADADHLKSILEEADPRLARMVNPATWPEQAQLAAQGKWEELEALKERLTAGRRA